MSRIAIVDDSRLIRAFVAGVLRAQGHDPLEVEPTSLAEVIKALHENVLDLLVVDYLMPDCPGESLIKACREDAKLQDTPILVLSAHRDEDSILRLQELGISGFLLKPVDPSVLVERVDGALAG